MEKLLAFLVLISSAVAAACVSMLAYAYSTGTIPFIDYPVYQQVADRAYQEKLRQAEKSRSLDISKERIAENFLYTFYAELSEERKKLDVERENIAEKKRNVEEILNQARLMQEKITKAEAKVNRILVFIDEKQQENLKRTAKMISGMDVAAASQLVMQWDDDRAAQILYFMNEKQAGQIIADVVQSGVEANVTKMKRIVAKVEQISEPPAEI